jgi:hypothetical protein
MKRVKMGTADPAKLLIVGDGPVTDALTRSGVHPGLVGVGHVDSADHRSRYRRRADHQPPGGCRRPGHPVGAGLRQALCRGHGLAAHVVAAPGVAHGRRCHKSALATLHAPVGLDIGADQPAEIALSILSEVVAVRAGRLSTISGAVTPIAERAGAVHPELHPASRPARAVESVDRRMAEPWRLRGNDGRPNGRVYLRASRVI